MNSRNRFLAVIVVAVVTGAFGYWLVRARAENDSGRIRVSGNVEIDDVELSFKIPGRVERRHVDEGMPVEKGQEVALLDRSDLELEVAIRREELRAAESTLQELRNGSRPEEKQAALAAKNRAEAAWKDLVSGSRDQEIRAARAARVKAEVERDRLKLDYDRARVLVEQNAIAREAFDRAKAAYEVALKQVDEAAERVDLLEEGFRHLQVEAAEHAYRQAEAEYALVMKGPREETIEQAEARRQQAEAALRLAETRLGYATLVSPLSGIVLSKNVEPGEYVAPGTPVVTVGNLEHVWLRAYVNETDLGKVRYGQGVDVTTDTYPGKVYRGRIAFIADEAEFTPKNVQTEKERVKLVYRIKIDVPNPDQDLKPGMPADAEILLDGR
jgi:HlyD family secretion protein